MRNQINLIVTELNHLGIVTAVVRHCKKGDSLLVTGDYSVFLSLYIDV